MRRGTGNGKSRRGGTIRDDYINRACIELTVLRDGGRREESSPYLLPMNTRISITQSLSVGGKVERKSPFEGLIEEIN